MRPKRQPSRRDRDVCCEDRDETLVHPRRDRDETLPSSRPLWGVITHVIVDYANIGYLQKALILCRVMKYTFLDRYSLVQNTRVLVQSGQSLLSGDMMRKAYKFHARWKFWIIFSMLVSHWKTYCDRSARYNIFNFWKCSTSISTLLVFTITEKQKCSDNHTQRN